MAKNLTPIAPKADPSLPWQGVKAASDARDLYTSLMEAFIATSTTKAPDGTPWRNVTLTWATEIVMANGEVKKWSFNRAYEYLAQAKGFTGADADPSAVSRALFVEGVIDIRHGSKGLVKASFTGGTPQVAGKAIDASEFGL